MSQSSGRIPDALTWKILAWMATGSMIEEPMVSSEPIRDMTNARKGTQQAVPKHAKAREVLTRMRLTPSDKPASASSMSSWLLSSKPGGGKAAFSGRSALSFAAALFLIRNSFSSL